ncbi:MAG: lysophospholipid acyltransferase family protein [Paracoccaceae bacterium]
MQGREIAREISYAGSAETAAGRAMIRAMENLTGRLALIRRAAGYETEVSDSRSFWQVICDRYGLSLKVVGGSLSNIPAAGPLVVIANHPYGILDGLMLGHLLDMARGDFRILANSVFRKAEALDRVVLPVNFDETKEAMRQNLETRAEALRYLAAGGCMGIFPGGTVSTAAKPFSRPMDPGWRTFTAKMIARSDATVVPVYFDGHNSRLFQIASHASMTLRLGLLIKEFRSRIDAPVRVVVGEPIPAARLAPLKTDPLAMMDFLRTATYALSPAPLRSYAYGHDFAARKRTR